MMVPEPTRREGDTISIRLKADEWKEILKTLIPHTDSPARCSQQEWCPEWKLAQKIKEALQV